VTDRKNEELFLIVDQGGHASRAVIMDGVGVPVAWAQRPLNTYRPQDSYVEHDPLELLLTVQESLEEVVRKVGSRVNSIRAAGLATQRSSIVCWDNQTGEALSQVISWQDTRAGDRVDAVSGMAEHVHEKTGLFLSAHYGASKLSWCLENISVVKEAWEIGRLCFGPMSSFIVQQLTGDKRFVADPVSASRTLLWNLRSGNWDPELLDLFEISENALPTCVPTVHGYGDLKLEKTRVPLALVTGDQSAALFAHGLLRAETAYVNMGTGAFVSRPTRTSPQLHPRLLTSVVHEQDSVRHYVLEGTVNGAGSALDWVREALGVEDLEERLPGWLSDVNDPPLFLNGISGLGAPYWDPKFQSDFIGEGPVPQKVVAVAESIVFLLNRNLLEMRHSISPPDRIQVTGGLSKLDGLCQRLADLSGISVYRPAESEATSRGTCFLLSGMPEAWPEPGPGKWFKPDDGTAIGERYDRWVREMEKRVNREQ